MTQFVIDSARNFAAIHHANQLYGKEPYTNHTDAVVSVLIEFGFGEDHNLIAAGHMHDLIEDTNVTIETLISAGFNDDIIALVAGVTNEPGHNRREKAFKTYPKIRKDVRRVALKLADRIANVRKSKAENRGLFHMYETEYPNFRNALYQKNELVSMWAELDQTFQKLPLF